MITERYLNLFFPVIVSQNTTTTEFLPAAIRQLASTNKRKHQRGGQERSHDMTTTLPTLLRTSTGTILNALGFRFGGLNVKSFHKVFGYLHIHQAEKVETVIQNPQPCTGMQESCLQSQCEGENTSDHKRHALPHPKVRIVWQDGTPVRQEKIRN